MAVRLESVRLSLEDDGFSTGMAKNAAAVALLKKELNSLSGTAVKSTSRDLNRVAQDIDNVGAFADRGGKQIDRLSGRMRLFGEAMATIGPIAVPIGAVAIPAVVGLAAGLGAAAGAAGVAVLAFNGMGDALGALNDYQLEPTQANLEKMRAEMDNLGPAGAEFAHFLDSLEPELKALQGLAREGMFPGVEDGLNSLMTLMPQVRQIVFNLATEMGDLASEAGAALSGDRWSAFFNYLKSDAAPTLEAFGHAIGNMVTGLGSIMVAFAPLTRDFSSGMEAMSRSFADWAAGLSQTQGFQDFVDYVRESGPKVLDLLGALATAFVGIAQAVAPVGDAVLPILTALAKVLGAVAASDIGQPLFAGAAALIAFNRAAKLLETGPMVKLGTLGKTAGAGIQTLAGDFALLGTSAMTAGAKSEREMARIAESTRRANMAMASVGKGVSFVAILTGIGLVDAAFNSLGDHIDETDLSRNLEALGRGEAIDDLKNLGTYIEQAASSWSYAKDKLSDIGTLGLDTSTLEKSQQEIEKVDQALASLVEGGQGDVAAAAFAQIAKQAAEAGVSGEDAAKAFDAYQTALANAGPTTDEAAAAQRRYTEAAGAAARVNGIAKAQVERLNATMEEQTSIALGAFDAVTQYAQALIDARKQAEKSDAGIKLTNDMTRKQRLEVIANRGALSQLSAAWNNQGDAVGNNMNKWRDARAEFIRVAKQMGATGAEARALADKVLDIPKQRQIDIKLYGAKEAADAIERVRQEMASIKDKTVRLTYYVNQVNSINKGPVTGPMSVNALGNLDPSDRANGHAPQLSRRPVTRIWNEPETQGESYIPHANDYRRPRAKSILEATASMFGGAVTWNADGVLTGGAATHASSRGNNLGFGLVGIAADSAAASMFNLAGMGKHELDVRSKLLSKEVDRDKQRADALKQEWDTIRSAVQDRFRSDLFGQTGPFSFGRAATPEAQLPDNFDQMTPAEQAAARADAEQKAQQTSMRNNAYMEGLQVRLNAQTEDPLAIMRNDIARAEEMERLLARAEKAGINGAALAELAQKADPNQIRALLAAPKLARQYDRLYDTRQRVSARAGGNVAQMVVGKKLDAAMDLYREQRDELRAVNRKLEQIRKENKHNSDDNARKSSDGLNTATANGHAGRAF